MFFGEKDKINIQIKENMMDKYNRFHMNIQQKVDKSQKPIYKYTKLLNKKSPYAKDVWYSSFQTS